MTDGSPARRGLGFGWRGLLVVGGEGVRRGVLNVMWFGRFVEGGAGGR